MPLGLKGVALFDAVKASGRFQRPELDALGSMLCGPKERRTAEQLLNCDLLWEAEEDCKYLHGPFRQAAIDCLKSKVAGELAREAGARVGPGGLAVIAPAIQQH